MLRCDSLMLLELCVITQAALMDQLDMQNFQVLPYSDFN